MKTRASQTFSSDPVIIEATAGLRHIDLKEIWRYRELLGFFIWRDIRVRYKQTAVGMLWAVLQPVLTMVVFSVFFGKFAKMPSGGHPYPIFVYAGLLPWMLFSQSLTWSSESIVANANLVKKVYFPRLIIPMAASLSAVVDFGVAFLVLLGMMVFYKVPFYPSLLALPVLVVLIVACSVGIGFWLSAINAMYRDVRYAVPFVIQLGFFMTPVIYPVDLLPDRWQWLLYLNPMAGLIENVRSVLLDGRIVAWQGLGISAVLTVVFLLSGALFFKRFERTFADVI